MSQKSALVASIVGFSLLFAGSVFAQSTVTVDLTKTKQSIRGFGGMIHRNWQGYDLSASDRDLAFGNGPGQIGLTVLRIPVNDLESDWNKELTVAKDVVSRGGIVYASPWNPPAALRTPYSFVRWGTTYNSHKISSSNYAAYAAHLNKFAKHMKDNGAPLFAISMQNEPDWCDAWTCWSADEVYDFIKSYGNNLREQGTRVISAESFAYSKSLYDKILNDTAALKNMDIIGAHFYGTNYSSNSDSAKISYFQYPLADQKAASKERWMTEHYTDSKGNANLWRGYIITGDQDQTPKYDTVRALDVAYEIHRALAEGNFNQYTWWYIRRNYGLIMHDATDNVKPTPTAAEAGKVSKRGYCVAQYAKYVRPGAVRVEATANPDRYVYVSAYKKADSVVIVAVNRAGQKTIPFSIPGATRITSWKKITTSATKSLNDDGTVTASNGSFSVSLDAESVTTLVGIIPAEVTVPQAPYTGTPISLPGTIEAENYDVGGEGVSYHDAEAENKGNQFRTDGVDIAGSAGAYQIGWTINGEWLEYTVQIENAASYKIEASVASGADNASFRLYLDSTTDISGLIAVPNTGSWTTFTTVSTTTPTLPAGKHVLRLSVEGAYFNVDALQFSLAPVNIHTSTEVTDPNEFQLFTLQGKYLGSISATNSTQAQKQAKANGIRTGMYLLRNIHNGSSMTFEIP